ncbi:hypothetical protein [Streptomyces axinellae]|uniref:Uncharacterized protein n=1 Tax=Streptomyces axinellae TaxID=552788 RepID=A0ABP6D4S4_9ACTN
MTHVTTGTNTYQRSDMRLLPWTSDTGKPCYVPLCAEGGGGPVSAIADTVEACQVADGWDVLAEAEDVLANPAAGPLALRLTLGTAVRAFGSVIRVAESRGQRLGLLDPDGA